jgi:hypothetical protein
MATGDSEQFFRTNWVAIISYAGSLALSVVIWTGVVLAVHRLVR